MKTFTTEAEVVDIIEERLLTADSRARVSVHSDKQSENSVQRTVIFKAVVALDKSEAIVNKMADIGTDTDRAVTYGGSQVEPTTEGEMRHLFFEAKINPYEEY